MLFPQKWGEMIDADFHEYVDVNNEWGIDQQRVARKTRHEVKIEVVTVKQSTCAKSGEVSVVDD